jgi:hypothetical protein
MAWGTAGLDFRPFVLVNTCQVTDLCWAGGRQYYSMKITIIEFKCVYSTIVISHVLIPSTIGIEASSLTNEIRLMTSAYVGNHCARVMNNGAFKSLINR